MYLKTKLQRKSHSDIQTLVRSEMFDQQVDDDNAHMTVYYYERNLRQKTKGPDSL